MVKLHASWLAHLKGEFEKPYMQNLKAFLLEEKQKNHQIYPPSEEIFAAFNQTPFEQVKVVIIGQDPYHGPSQANGLCFSVHRNLALPPSLKNIYKELEADLKIKMPAHGDLRAWAEQGVLMLNATLTVRALEAGSHQNKGWEIFTDEVIQLLDRKKQNLVFMLWGNFARSKKRLIHKNAVLESTHPSPFSAHQGFLGCRHFSKANALLVEKGLSPVDWQIS